jgi:hypothetical protein
VPQVADVAPDAPEAPRVVEAPPVPDLSCLETEEPRLPRCRRDASGYCTVVAEGVEAGADTPVVLTMPTEGRVRVHTSRSYGDARAQLGEHRIDLECRKGQLLGLPAGPVRVHLVESGEVVSTREVDIVPGRILDVDFP